jgi:tetratricopeptide (TPR) repeat protein
MRLLDAEIDQATKNADPKLTELKSNRSKFLVQSYQRRVADRPTDMGLRFELGKGYYVSGENDKAIAEFQQAVKDPKRKRESHIYLGMAFQRKRLFDMADTQYAKAEEEAGGVLSQATLLSIWYNRMLCNAEAGKKDAAIALGKKIMEQDIAYRDTSALVEKWSANGAS